MSYILDALRKADAERARDPSRGIHAQTVGTPAAQPPSPVWPIAAAAVVLAGIASWLLMPRPLPPAPAVPAPPPAAPIAAPVVLPPAPPQLAQQPAVVAKPAVVQASGQVPAPAAAPAAAVASKPAASGAVAIAPSGRVLTVAELPADVQRDLPRLPLSGGVYSQNAAQRMLIVNGQVAGEGTEVAPGLVLEQIQPKAAVLRFRGWRYSVPY
jgi:general secretion pathway protein B